MTVTMTRTVLTRTGRRRMGYALSGLLAATTALFLAGPQIGAHAAALPDKSEGIMCETPDTDPQGNPTFNLDARAGYISTPDGNSVYMWSYTATGRSFQLPGPTLCVGSGQTVTVILHNSLREDTSIVFAGQTGVLADGKPTQPQFTSGVLTSLVDAAPKTNGTITYQFTAGNPGTYLYSSGTDVLKQKEMGLYGALIVRPVAGGALDTTHDAAGSAFPFDPSTEYLYVLSQIDPDLHSAVELNKNYSYNTSKARYFFINGRSMPDTLAPNNAAWLPSQPYGALIHIHPTKTGSSPALVRYVNAGTVNYPFHPHGSSQRVIVRDGVPVTDGASNDASYLKFLVDVGPGQSADTLESWTQEYNTSDKQIPSDVQLPQVQDQIVGPGTETWFSENPYLGAPGGLGPIPNGMVQNNECGEYYHVAHSHALYQATNFGASFGGMMTLIRIDPPTPNNCAAQ
ncbi:MAG: multicopper oxidase domain-containing protein [Kineosporiaceae bacterium]